MKRNILNSPRLLELKKKRRKIFLNKVLIFTLIFLVIFIGLAYLSRVSALNISSVEIINNKVIDTENIKNSVDIELSGFYLWFFPKKNILLYSKNSIKEKLMNEFPRIKDVNISLQEEKKLEVSITERTALYTWCGETLPEIETGSTTSECYFLDDSGYIFAEAPYFSGEVYFKFFGSINQKNESFVGSSFYPDTFQKIISFKNTLEDIKLKPVALLMAEDGNIKMFLSSETSVMGPVILFQTDSDFKKIVENLETALDTDPLKTNFKDKYSLLEYIDLRFGNRVYYKFK